MIYFVISKNKFLKILYLLRYFFSNGFLKTFFFIKLYRYLNEKNFLNFSKYSEKILKLNFKKNDLINKQFIEYQNLILFDKLSKAAKVRFDIFENLQSNTYLSNKFKAYQDFNFSYREIKSEKINKNFLNFVKGKELLFLGPGMGDNFDIKNEILITTNITDQVLNIKNCKKISYFSNRRVRLFKEITINKINKCDFSILKNQSSYNSLELVSSNLRYLRDEPLFLCGSPMMLQIVLSDLLIYKPKKIILKNFDLYTSKVSYNPNYRTEANKKEIKIKSALSLRIHDVLSNFIFFKNLYLRNKEIIEIDSKLLDILKLNLHDYSILVDENSIDGISFLNQSYDILRT